MKKHLIYIATDANRAYFEAGYTQDLLAQSSSLRFQAIHNVGIQPKFNRIVHIEEFTSLDMAQKRLTELNNFTRMQKEKLIRRYNPNWLNISFSYNALATPSNLNRTRTYAASC